MSIIIGQIKNYAKFYCFIGTYYFEINFSFKQENNRISNY